MNQQEPAPCQYRPAPPAPSQSAPPAAGSGTPPKSSDVAVSLDLEDKNGRVSLTRRCSAEYPVENVYL